MKLEGKVAVVTGAGRGIGRAVSLGLAAERCHVVGVARSTGELDALVAEIRGNGGEATALTADLAKMGESRAVVPEVLRRLGRVDILVNNAGVIFHRPFLDATEEEFDYTMNVNLKSMFILCQEALRAMQARKSGYIVNISSTVALGVPEPLATYGMSKCGVVGLTQALYAAAKPHGIKVSVVYPGITDTPMVRALPCRTRPEQWMAPDDIAGCILFLLRQSDRVVVKDVVPWSTGFDCI